MHLYEGLSAELNFNLLFSQQGHLTLAHTDRAMFVMNERAEVNQLVGIDSKVIEPEEIGRLTQAMSLDPDAVYPVMGALYHPPGGIIRHDAVVWGFASGADGAGAEIHPYRKVTEIERSNGRATGVVLADGRRIEAGTVVSTTAGWSSTVAGIASIKLPITTHILQAFVTEALKPLLDVVVVSSQMHVYISQTDRGEFLVGAEIEPWTTYRQQGTLTFLQECSRHTASSSSRSWNARGSSEAGRGCATHAGLQPDLGRTEVDGFLQRRVGHLPASRRRGQDPGRADRHRTRSRS